MRKYFDYQTSLMDEEGPTDSTCPLDGRRTSTEVWVKILIAHFTTIAAFCHLLSIRNEKILGIRLAFFFISPLVFVINHGLAIIAIIGYRLYWRLRWLPNQGKHPKRALRILCGKIPKVLRASRSYELLPTSDPAESGGLGEKWESKQVGRIVVALAFLVQCIGSVVFYRRRQSQEAVTTADTLMVELAYAGILISGLTIATLARFSLFAEDAPIIEDDDASPLDATMQHLRESVSPNPNPRRIVIGQILAGGISLWIWLLLSREVDLVGSWAAMLSLFTPAESIAVYPHYMMGLVGFVGVFVLISQVVLFAVSALLALYFNRARANRSGTSNQSLFIAWPSDTGDTVMCFFSFFVLSALMWKPTQFAEIRVELDTLAQWPTNTTCPGGVWNDPAANWAWLLA